MADIEDIEDGIASSSSGAEHDGDKHDDRTDSKADSLWAQLTLYIVVPLVIIISLLSGLAFLIFLVRRRSEEDDGYTMLETM